MRRLNDLIGDLQTHIRRGSQEAMEIPEPPGEVRRSTDEGRRMEQQWREWVQRWNRGVDSMAKPYGDGATAAADQHIVLAGEQLRLAVSDLRLFSLASPGLTYLSKQARRQRFESAQSRVTTARDHLNRIGHPPEPVHE